MLACNLCEGYIAVCMKRISYLYLLCSIAFLSSCKSLKTSGSNDNRNTKSNQANGNSVFIDNISVTPGGDRTVINTINNKTVLPATRTSSKNFDIESATQVQLKYATMLDVPVEDLTNVGLLQDIDSWWGTRYCMGGSTVACTDCSAFTQTIIRDIYAVQLPRTAEEQFNSSQRIDASELQEGDLVFFQTTGRTISHVGVYLANNKFVHASVSNGVMISDLNETYWRSKYRAAGRVKR